MHLREKQLGATPLFAIFLNYPFWCQKHHFSPNTGLFLVYTINYQAFAVVRPQFLPIDHNPRRGEKIYMDPASKARFAQRSSAERVNAYLKDNYGGRNIRVKGAAKVMTHLMFGIIAITATQLFHLLE